MKSVSTYLYATLCVCLFFMSSSVLADWNLGDGHKMHYPQLPDSTGWDIYAEYPMGLADNWMAADDGPIKQIHFWGSWRQDNIGQTGDIIVRIYDNDTSGSFDTPGDVLWSQIISEEEYKVRLYSGGAEKGWYFPNLGDLPGAYSENDHQQIWQYNVPIVSEPFYPQGGNIYWLGVGVDFSGDLAYWGWESTQDHYGSTAVFWDSLAGQWDELSDPITGELLDLAFVVEHTPEPATVCFLGLGALALLRRRRQ